MDSSLSKTLNETMTLVVYIKYVTIGWYSNVISAGRYFIKTARAAYTLFVIEQEYVHLNVPYKLQVIYHYCKLNISIHWRPVIQAKAGVQANAGVQAKTGVGDIVHSCGKINTPTHSVQGGPKHWGHISNTLNTWINKENGEFYWFLVNRRTANQFRVFKDMKNDKIIIIISIIITINSWLIQVSEIIRDVLNWNLNATQ